MSSRAALAGACLLFLAALPAAAQMAPTHRIEARMDAGSIAVGGAAEATLEATRICPGDAVVLPEAVAEVVLDVPSGIAATSPQQVCARDPRATAVLRVRVEATAAAEPGLHRIGVLLRASQLVGPPDEQEAALAFTVVQPAGDGEGGLPAAPEGAGHAAPAPGVLAGLAALALAAARRRQVA